MDFDESDESLEEEDELDAELSFLLIDKLSICIYIYMYMEITSQIMIYMYMYI